ncbi:MAG: catechol 2,3-dioxygenase-like lactoylglutathione lyase family enzyme [Yoonia sp.]|jgi:catechol 2,3-dioxygenase-like lactoylglutathione lyase family enzyme
MDDLAVIHFVEVPDPPQAAGNVTLERFAFRATDMAGIRLRLDDRGVAYTIDPVPGFPVVQINLHDPDGNLIYFGSA